MSIDPFLVVSGVKALCDSLIQTKYCNLDAINLKDKIARFNSEFSLPKHETRKLSDAAKGALKALHDILDEISIFFQNELQIITEDNEEENDVFQHYGYDLFGFVSYSSHRSRGSSTASSNSCRHYYYMDKFNYLNKEFESRCNEYYRYLNNDAADVESLNDMLCRCFDGDLSGSNNSLNTKKSWLKLKSKITDTLFAVKMMQNVSEVEILRWKSLKDVSNRNIANVVNVFQDIDDSGMCVLVDYISTITLESICIGKL